MRCFFPWLGIFLLLFPQTVLAQQESIVSYRSTIQIEKSSDLVVTENIIVNAQGTSIQHGIYRDFPVRYRDQHGVSYRVPFETISILKNGIPEPYHIEKNGAYERIYIGSRDFNLAPGQYLYTLVFRTSRQVGYFPDHDELYFNAVGTGWDFPIGRAEVEVILPPGVPRNSVKAYAYTGPEGSRARDYWTAVTPSGNLRFTSSRPFEPHEGITVVIEWPKGFVHEPTAAERRQYFIADNWHVLIASGGLIILLVYFIFAWETAGKDPPKGTVIPLYAPPNGFSPAACRYLQTMSFDNPGFASAILGLAVKNYIRIEEPSPKEYTLHNLRKAGDRRELQPEESATLQALFSPRQTLKEILSFIFGRFAGAFGVRDDSSSNPREEASSVDISSQNGSTLQIARLNCERALQRRFDEKLFSRNTGFLLLAILIAVISWGFLLPTESPLLIIGGALVFGMVVFAFARMIKAPSPTGRRILDQIEGFQMYLGTAEGERLNLENPPDRTPQLFEMFLPYAFALGVSQEWSNQFHRVLAAAGYVRDGTFRSSWYSGTSSPLDIGGSLGSSLSSSISSSLPSSSSGSGGSSGGGGGGGGGGGW